MRSGEVVYSLTPRAELQVTNRQRTQISRGSIPAQGQNGMTLEFEWDIRKARANLRKHGVTFEEALTVFGDPLAAIFPDEAHSIGEERELIIGHSDRGRLLLVSFTERGTTIRIIGARLATRRERRDYEENPLS